MSRALSSWFTEFQVYTTHVGVNKLGFPLKKNKREYLFFKKVLGFKT